MVVLLVQRQPLAQRRQLVVDVLPLRAERGAKRHPAGGHKAAQLRHDRAPCAVARGLPRSGPGPRLTRTPRGQWEGGVGVGAAFLTAGQVGNQIERDDSGYTRLADTGVISGAMAEAQHGSLAESRQGSKLKHASCMLQWNYMR